MFRFHAIVWLLLFFFSLTLSWAQSNNLNQLRSQANAALFDGDHVTAAYYYQRMMESPDWENYPDKINVLGQMALIEESQARSAEAVKYYEKIQEIVESDSSAPDNARIDYYTQRYADALERAGYYKKAAQQYWELFEKGTSSNKTLYLMRILENYSYQSVSQEEMEKLRSLIIPQFRETLGWNLASLFRKQGMLEESYELYESLWPQQLAKARQSADSMYETYTQIDAFDDLLQRVQEQRQKGDHLFSHLMLELELLQLDGQVEEALQRLENVLLQENQNPVDAVGALLSQIPKDLLNLWVDLVEDQRGREEAIAIMQRIVKHSPLDLSHRERLSTMLVKAGNSDEALTLWREWMELQPGNPLSKLKAAEKIYSLGLQEEAEEILENNIENIQPKLASNEADTALRLGLYDQAFSAYEIAVATGGVKPERVSNSILNFAERMPDSKPLIASLLKNATGRAFDEVPEWIRTPLLELAIQPAFMEELNQLAESDPAGLWHLNLAQAAVKQGHTQWAKQCLRSIPEDNKYQHTAKRELAQLLSREESIEEKKKAAALMRPSVEMVLDTTETIPLSNVLVDRLMKYSELRLDAYQPGAALQAIRNIEDASHTLDRPLTEKQIDRLQFLRARAMLEFSSLNAAIDLLEQIHFQPQKTEALYLLAKTHLVLGNMEQAEHLLQELVEKDTYWKRANDALRMMVMLEPLVGEALELYQLANLYQLQGRFSDAVPFLRQLAVKHYGEDMEEWARYEIGQLLKNQGDKEGAREEWKRLLVDVDHPVIHGIVQLKLLQSTQTADEAQSATQYQDLLLEFPDTIFSDLARLEMQHNLSTVNP